MQVRRIVTGHDASGKAVVKTDEILTAVSRGGVANVSGCEIWSTDRMPVDNSAAADAAKRAGFVGQNLNYVGTGQGTLVRIDEWGPGNARFTHRTETLDYVFMLSGEIDLELDSGEVIHAKTGDVVLNRGGLHTWVNKGSVPAVMAVVMVDAKPVEVNGKELRTQYPALQKSI
jgi:uncharacterized cupin superfamily protein